MAFEDLPDEETILALTAPDAPAPNFDVLTPAEFAELSWRVVEGLDPLDIDGHEGFELPERLYLVELVERNPDHLRAIVEALGDRAVADDRSKIAEYDVETYINLHRDIGLMLLDRLVRDVDPAVREAALGTLHSIVLDSISDEVARTLPYDNRGSLDNVAAVDLVAYVDPDLLRERANGMTIDEVIDLYEAAAYAENGQYLHDIARRALLKLIAASRQDAGRTTTERSEPTRGDDAASDVPGT